MDRHLRDQQAPCLFIPNVYGPGLATQVLDIFLHDSRLWLLLKRRGYSPRDIIHLAGISESTYRRMSWNEPVRMCWRGCAQPSGLTWGMCVHSALSRRESDRCIIAWRHIRLTSPGVAGYQSFTQRTMNTVHPSTAVPPTYLTFSAGKYRKNPDR